jgi:hypothetical protein
MHAALSLRSVHAWHDVKLALRDQGARSSRLKDGATKQDTLSEDVNRAMMRGWHGAYSRFSWLSIAFAWLDRVNLGFTALQMNRDLGFGPAMYGFG